jgi:hypothetical protein
MSSRPHPILGMRRRQRASGEPFMIAVVAEALILAAGTELHLRRMHDGKLPGPEFALMAIPPKKPLTTKQRDQDAADRLDGGAVRNVTPPEPAPW